MVELDNQCLTLLHNIYKNKSLTKSEIYNLHSKDIIIKLKKAHCINKYFYNGVHLYTLSKLGSDIINVPYNETAFVENMIPNYILSFKEKNILLSFAFCGVLSATNVEKEYNMINIEKCLLYQYIEPTTINGQAYYRLTEIGCEILKDNNVIYIRKNNNPKYSQFLFENFSKLSVDVLLTYLTLDLDKNKSKKILQSLMSSEFIIMDIETVSYSNVSNEKILEIGAVKISNGNVIETFNKLIYNEDTSIPKSIVELTGITSKMIAKGEPIEEVLKEFISFINDLPLVAHGVKNDWHHFILKSLFKHDLYIPSNKLFDSYEIATSLYPNNKNGLDSLIERFNLNTKSTKRHRALNDSNLTFEIIECIINDLYKENNIGCKK